MSRAGETVEDRQNRALIALRQAVTLKAAAQAAGVNPSTIYSWIRNDLHGFSARYDEANRDRMDNLEGRMFDVLNWATGEENYEKTLRYPNLMMFALRGAFPERYGDRSVMGSEDAQKLLEELRKMKDEPTVQGGGVVKSIDDQLNELLGS
jgi:DNA-binding GntR family transcriptional regulator